MSLLNNDSVFPPTPPFSTRMDLQHIGRHAFKRYCQRAHADGAVFFKKLDDGCGWREMSPTFYALQLFAATSYPNLYTDVSFCVVVPPAPEGGAK